VKSLFSLFKRYSSDKMVVWGIVLGLLSGVSASAVLHVMREVLYETGDTSLLVLGLLFAGLSLFTAVSRYLATVVLVNLGAHSVANMQQQLSRKILGSPMRRLEELGTHRLMVTLTNDIAAITTAVANLPVLFINAASVVGCLVYMAWLSWTEMLVVLVVMAVGIPAYLAAVRAGSNRQRRAREVEDDLFKHFRAATQGSKELKMRRSRRESFLALLRATAVRFRDLRIDALKVLLAAASLGNLLFYIAMGAILFAPTPGVEGIKDKAGYVLAILYFIGPLQVLLTALPSLTQAEASIQKIERLGLWEEPGEMGETGGEALRPDWQLIELQGATLTYPPQEQEDSSFTLGPIDLVLRREEIVFLAGGNGSGKTTLAKVLIGLYPPDSGRILVDGKPVTNDNRDEFRQHFSVVFADYFLFDSLLGFDSPENEEKAREYLAQLRLQHKVRIARGKLSTIELSQGQRKRLALLMAFLEDSPVFVFDEWAADQDPEFRELFYYQILPALRDRGKTVLVISHDERYFHMGDRVLQMDYGKLAADQPLSREEYATA
jgi:putative ATP-binding cassette transporter